jgi:ERCC4-type nuclease
VKPAPLHILVDTREQTPCPFPDGVTTERATIGEGDYTTPSLRELAVVERKSGADLAATLTWGRERFDAEVERLKKYRHRLVCVECDLGDFYSGKIQTQMHPHALIGSMASLYARHDIPVMFLRSPAIMGRFIAGVFRRLEEIYGSHEKGQAADGERADGQPVTAAATGGATR